MPIPSPGLRVFASNRLENLAERLASLLERPLSSPLAPETIVVPNQGMARWLAQRLAERLGVWANFRFTYPDGLIGEAVRALVPGAPSERAFEPEVLTWRILGHLPALLKGPASTELRGYLAGDALGVKGFQLARRLAETFELYGVFRPDLLSSWERGEEEDWHADLWRALARDHPGAHKAALMGQLLARAAGASLDPGTLPDRVSVFGLATLAPVRLRVLATLAERTEVSLFVVNPARDYWGDILSQGEAARERRRTPGGDGSADALHLETGNPLLASFGRLGRDFLDELLDVAGTEGEPCFADPGEDSLLHCLQSDILNLRERPGPAGAATPLDPGDVSLQIHSCHGPMREVEVLHDHLLEMFETMPGLRPGDVLVAAPDIEAYAPYITAVFEGNGDPGRRIPYAVAAGSGRSSVVDAFFRLLELPEGRFGAAEVLDLLETGELRRAFGLSAEDLETVRGWVEETRIRWGVDGEDRGRRGVPAFEENSWRAGLRRLLLGYALPGEEGRLFAGILPFDVEGAHARALGALAELVEQLVAAVEDLSHPRPLARWASDLGGLLGRFLLPDEAGETDAERIRRELARLADTETLAGFAEPVGLRVVRLHLRSRLERDDSGPELLAGKVAFCSLRPLRSIPFRVVALIGMNDGAFPRTATSPGFDRMARARRRGDPSLRDEDRYLFLEALLSARQRLYLSYTGQSVRDGSEIPPSPVVSELLDAVTRGFRHARGGDLEKRLVTRHRLQAFSPAYFGADERLFTYSAENLEGAAARRAEPRAYAQLVPSPLPEPGEEFRNVDVETLAGFFAHPARFFLVERLGIRLGADTFRVEESEPFRVSGLDRFRLEQDLVAAVLEGRDPEAELALFRARGLLPPGRLGEAAGGAPKGRAQAFAERLRPYLAGGELPTLEVDVALGEFRVSGRLRGIWREGLIRQRVAFVKGRDRIRLWVEHLVLGCAAPAGYPDRSLLFGTDGAFRYRRPADARELLGELLELYWQGLREPLPFFPESSLAYVARSQSPETAARALASARAAWEGQDRPGAPKGEGEDPYHLFCFGRIDPLDRRFEDLSERIGTPLLAQEGKL